MTATEIRERAIEECRAALTAENLDFTGKRYDETYGEVDAQGLTLEKINEVLDRLKVEPVDQLVSAAPAPAGIRWPHDAEGREVPA